MFANLHAVSVSGVLERSVHSWLPASPADNCVYSLCHRSDPTSLSMSSNELRNSCIRPTACASDVKSAVSVNASMITSGEDRYEGMNISKENKVFRIQLNRPKRKNALTTQMYYDLTSALREAAEDEEVVIAVITGTGDYYCSGNDLANFLSSANPGDIDERVKTGSRPVYNLVKAFIDFPKPLIALVNGPAIGIAVTLLGLCDAVYCSDKATFLTPFTQLGQNAEGCSSYIFPKIMGSAKASEMLLFNKKITAQEALERNLVTKVIPDADFQKKTETVVSDMASLPPQSLQLSKQLLRSHERELLHQVNEAEMKLIAERVKSPEVFEAVMAFFNRKNSKL